MQRVMVLLISLLLLFQASMTAYGQEEGDDLQIIEVKYGDQVFEVQAAMPGDGTIGAIQVFPEYGSILITLNADPETTEGELRIVLPRALIDSKAQDGGDTDFLVIVDGEDLGYDEISTIDTKRELHIPIPEGSTQVEIFGSQVLPEFQIGFMLLLTVSAFITIIIAYQRGNKRRQLPI